MDQETFADQMRGMKEETMNAFRKSCVCPNRLENGVKLSLSTLLEKQIDEQIAVCVERHNDMIDENGLRIVYDGRKRVSERVSILCVENGSCADVMSFEWTDVFTEMKQIIIGDNCCQRVRSFTLCGLPKLEVVRIGVNAFTESPNGVGDEGKVFSITNCRSLDTLSIGSFSFSDFGEFILEEVDKLQYLMIGKRKQRSCNFYHASFVLRSLPYGN